MTSRYVVGLGGALWAALSEGKEFACEGKKVFQMRVLKLGFLKICL